MSTNSIVTRYPRVIPFIPAILVVIIRLSLLPSVPIPEPQVHDEFSYLLGADTFASGRLTNPPHPMWVHFETFHVNPLPTYATKYPPGQSLFLALGQKFFGHPWYGVLISVAFMCGAICWMLQGWLSAEYVVIGSLLTVLEFGVSTYWVNSYWGGALPAAGGALLIGAIPRLRRRTTAGTAFLAALGMIILANTRPFEGLITTVSCTVALLWWMKRTGRSWLRLFQTSVVPAVFLMLFAGLWMGYYNYRLTGKPWLMPYIVNQRLYAASPHFWLMPLGNPPAYRHEMLRKFWALDRDAYLEARANPLIVPAMLVWMVAGFFVVPLLFLPAMAVILMPTRKVAVALGVCGGLAFALLLEKGFAAHYFAPVTGLMVFLACTGIRSILKTFPPRSVARAGTAVALTGLFLYLFTVRTFDSAIKDPKFTLFAIQRQSVIRALSDTGGRHVVIVRYGPRHAPGLDWVYNKADIDGSNIVWARDMGDAKNAELVAYYSDRRIWLVEPDSLPLKLRPYGTLMHTHLQGE